MAEYQLATVAGGDAALVVQGTAYGLGAPMAALLEDWDATLGRLDDHAARGDLEALGPLDELTLLAPVPRPPNVYMAGANYADHAREMRGLGADEAVPKPARGPFMFLKPTTTLIGHRDAIVVSPQAERVDWEIELAVVIGRRGHRVSAERASELIAGYTIANDISVRGSFVRDDMPEPPMRYDWLLQKGWATSGPMGPVLVPAAQLPDAQDTAMRLTLNGETRQDSRTSEMIFSIAEQIVFLAELLPLMPGDIICTGTCAGVGMGSGRFLHDGDVLVAEIDGIGRLENPVTRG